MKRIDLGSKPYVFPMPVLIIGTYDENKNPNVMNAAWGMITDYDEISISLAEHKTTDNLKKNKAFTVSFATKDYVVNSDYVGIESGSKVKNKFEKSGFHAIQSKKVNAPLIEELPVGLECEVKSFKEGILIGKIVNISCDESVLTEGKPDIEKLNPILYNCFDNGYYTIGKKVGQAFHDGMKIK